MKETTIVRENLMEDKSYTPYCGDSLCLPRTSSSPERWPRTKFDGEQFVCPKCRWKSNFPNEFMERYKQKHKI